MQTVQQFGVAIPQAGEIIVHGLRAAIDSTMEEDFLRFASRCYERFQHYFTICNYPFSGAQSMGMVYTFSSSVAAP